MDDDGYFYLVDRKKDMIISGGFNVYPQMIEQAIYEHPAGARSDRDRHSRRLSRRGGQGVRQAARRCRAVHASTSCKAFLAGKLGKHEIPAALEFVDELPRTSVGKLSRHELRNRQPAQPKQTATGARAAHLSHRRGRI